MVYECRPDDEVDRHIGARLAALRVRHGLDAAKLAEAIGVTAIDVLSCEAGSERMPAGCLLRAATFFGVHINRFFEHVPAVPLDEVGQAAAHALARFLTMPGALELIDAYAAIEDEC